MDPLLIKYPASPSCSCQICLNYCKRPGWWTVDEAEKAIEMGYTKRMMLEMAPEFTFGVLSPAFAGCESNFALQPFAKNGCCFLKEGLCELHGTGVQPLECRFCHHDRLGQGEKCHADIEQQWNTEKGYILIGHWIEETRFIYADIYYQLIKRTKK